MERAAKILRYGGDLLLLIPAAFVVLGLIVYMIPQLVEETFRHGLKYALSDL